MVGRAHAVIVGCEVSDLSVGDPYYWLVGGSGWGVAIVANVAKHRRGGA